jgi:gamma-glutamyl-gamma-aminobutyrate hydrolase PuuD
MISVNEEMEMTDGRQNTTSREDNEAIEVNSALTIDVHQENNVQLIANDILHQMTLVNSDRIEEEEEDLDGVIEAIEERDSKISNGINTM